MMRRVLVAGGIGAVLLVWVGMGLWPPAVRVPPQWAVLSNVTVINPGRDRRPNQTVIVAGNVIESISERPVEGRLQPITRLLAKRYVLPGLIDMNVHQPPRFSGLQRLFGLFFLAMGVTTVRDTGNFHGGIPEMEREIANGERPWPRVVACGRILEGDPPVCPESRAVRDAVDARAAVEELAAAGAHCVTVSWNLSGESLSAVRDAAAARGLPVIGHVPAGVPLATAGLRDVQLLTAIPSPAGVRGLSDLLSAWQLPDEASIDAIARTAVEQGVSLTPSVFRWRQLARLGDPSLLDEPFASHLPRLCRTLFWDPETARAEAMRPWHAHGERGGRSSRATSEEAAQLQSGSAAATTEMLKAVRRLRTAGARVHVGTGAPSPFVIPGISVYQEMGSLVMAGLTLEEAWVAATRAAGESLGVPKLGLLEAGAPADFLVFRDDPTQDAGALGSLEAVVSQGRLYPRGLIARMIMEHGSYSGHPLREWPSRVAVRFLSWWDGRAESGCYWP